MQSRLLKIKYKTPKDEKRGEARPDIRKCGKIDIALALNYLKDFAETISCWTSS